MLEFEFSCLLINLTDEIINNDPPFLCFCNEERGNLEETKEEWN
jgi:hypothetical protein